MDPQDLLGAHALLGRLFIQLQAAQEEVQRLRQAVAEFERQNSEPGNHTPKRPDEG